MDTHSEEHRHACEVRTVLDMPLDRRGGYIDLVANRRGVEAARVLRADVYRTWIARQVDKLAAMTPAARGIRLAQIESSSNKRTRTDVEAALDRQLAASNDNLKDDNGTGRIFQTAG